MSDEKKLKGRVNGLKEGMTKIHFDGLSFIKG